ncbi:MAG TPA: hypothetical protein DCE41_24700 [Cytophagales bacterium]|nr:hypothetical protein [Cytophagales bacterium]HAA22735.1 hypothetical protein [Cytophagales bacterium]HAP60310.1 hypothetical protein [Cytophagales bacterium]
MSKPSLAFLLLLLLLLFSFVSTRSYWAQWNSIGPDGRLALGVKGIVCHSADSVQNWATLNGGNSTIIGVEILKPTDQNVLYATVPRKGIFRSDDLRLPWDSLAVSPATSEVLNLTVEG